MLSSSLQWRIIVKMLTSPQGLFNVRPDLPEKQQK